MHVSYDIVDMHVAVSFTDRMFHISLFTRRPRPFAGGDSRALSRLPASQLGSQSGRAVHYYFVSELLPVQCTNQIIVHGTAGSGCLTEMQVAWIVHGCLRLRVDVAVY